MLNSVKLHALAGYTSKTTGIDSLSSCLDPTHFANFPHEVSYVYNSRGFRDTEWPVDNDLKNSIWCIGDSFTTGVGSPFSHTWPQVLGQRSKQRVINVSMDGASNQWIARKCCEIYNQIQPLNMVIMWSYSHRREHPDTSKSDLDRRIHSVNSTEDQDLDDLIACMKQVRENCASSKLVEFIIPYGLSASLEPTLTQQDWDAIKADNWPTIMPDNEEKFQQLPSAILQELQQIFNIDIKKVLAQLVMQKKMQFINKAIQVNTLDTARDGHHFDIITAQWVAAQAEKQLTQEQGPTNSHIPDLLDHEGG
jgi:hypothetical protein